VSIDLSRTISGPPFKPSFLGAVVDFELILRVLLQIPKVILDFREKQIEPPQQIGSKKDC